MRKHLFFVGVLGFVLLSACQHGASHHHHHHHGDARTEEHAHEESDSETHHHSDAIVLAPEKAKAAGVQVSTVEPGDFHGVLATSGKVLSASGDEITLVATVAGVVSLNRPITEGMAIGKGTPVFTIASSNLQDGDVAQRTRIAYETAKAEYERAQALVADKIISEKDFLALRADYQTAALAYKAVGQNGNSTGVTVKSPDGGYVKECLVRDGDFVEIGQPMLVVTHNRRLYLRAEVAERDYGILNRIVSAKFKTSYSDEVYDIKELKGRLLSYGKTPGSASSFIPVTFEFDNCSGVIPGAFAEIYLLTGSRSNVISVPVTALTEEQGVYFVYIQEDEDCYRKQEVALGMSDGERTEIVHGLVGGENLVTEGAVHVKLASAGKSIPGHTHNH
ncbi:MAG: efflux RND transporter periplasmic adaptor subunit [Alistipes senegalensis]|nr:efflux RND transporter periplasmic adaptor subunit [Bacteroides cellulosilyticus]MCM1352889.1 efflux RND transporter periplasmic adaptor subunit [Alistipes senegalensis]